MSLSEYSDRLTVQALAARLAQLEKDALRRIFYQTYRDVDIYPRDLAARDWLRGAYRAATSAFPELVAEVVGADFDVEVYIALRDAVPRPIALPGVERQLGAYALDATAERLEGFSSDGAWYVSVSVALPQRWGMLPDDLVEIADAVTIPLVAREYRVPGDVLVSPGEQHLAQQAEFMQLISLRIRDAQARAAVRRYADVSPVDFWLGVAAWAVEAPDLREGELRVWHATMLDYDDRK